ncbi:hypothetical protein FA95DRAFT_1576134 [Auriscalpium vulgare]|uniref:Uncharacterized protein n=1 Tax=Auriscalpium vulgare TaxID=40419 RepID=A0ACB8RDQ9_9AGAM|nr:hypothetical protein FA95DRAFT_1576134 [Auriscalpium vulgare]
MEHTYPPRSSPAPIVPRAQPPISSFPNQPTPSPTSRMDPNLPWIFMPPFATLVHAEISSHDPFLPGATHWTAACCPDKLLRTGDHVTLIPSDTAPAISAKIRGVRAIERLAIEFWIVPLAEEDLGRHLLTVPYEWTVPDWRVRLYRWLAAPSLPPNFPPRAKSYASRVPCEGNCLHIRFNPTMRRKIPAEERVAASTALDEVGSVATTIKVEPDHLECSESLPTVCVRQDPANCPHTSDFRSPPANQVDIMPAGSKEAPVKASAAARKLAAAGPHAASAPVRQTRGMTADARALSPTPAARNGRSSRSRRTTEVANAAAGPSRDRTPVLNAHAHAGPSLASITLDPFGGEDYTGPGNPYALQAVGGDRFSFWGANDRSPSPATVEETLASVVDAPWSPIPYPLDLPPRPPLAAHYQEEPEATTDEPAAARAQSPLSPAPASPSPNKENLPPLEHLPGRLSPEPPLLPAPLLSQHDTPQYVKPPSAEEKKRTMGRILYDGARMPQVEAALNPPAFTVGTFPPIHFAHHAVAFEDTSRPQVTEWLDIETAKLIVRPFEPPARSPTEQAPVAIKLAQLLTAITGLPSIEVSVPIRSSLAIKAGRHPKGYLAHGLTPDAAQLVLARGVWSSRELTFHAIPFEARLPSLLFRLAGLTTRDPAIVRRIVRFTWTQAPIQEFFAALVDSTKTDVRPLTDAHIEHVVSSMRATRVDFKQPGGISTPLYAITIDSSQIPEDVYWYAIINRLKSLRYETSMYGTGVFEPLSLCLLCHGVDHPRGLCPFPDIPGWNGGGQRPPQFSSAPPRHRAPANPADDARAEAAQSANAARSRDRFPGDRFPAFQN